LISDGAMARKFVNLIFILVVLPILEEYFLKMDTGSKHSEELRQQKDVQDALKELDSNYRERKNQTHLIASTSERFYLTVYISIFVGLIIVHFAFHLDQLRIEEKYLPIMPHIITGGISVSLILIIGSLIKILYINEIRDKGTRFNLTRVLRFFIGTILFLIILSIFYANWYTAVVSLGLLSIILGFALQTPILSFIGWIYIVIRRPFKIGDRIRVGDNEGDVIDIDYLDTTMWEIKGNLSTDHPSGRIIRFPNSSILNTSIFNYSWALFPFIFDEIIFYVPYDSELDELATIIKEIASGEIGTNIGSEIRDYKIILRQAHVDDNNIDEGPEISFKPGDNMWLQAILTYPVHPKDERKIKTLITEKILQRLNYKGNIYFPSGNGR
jgi:small-conductance mechanosensitive channel